jgi:hypothetical protein
MDSSYRSLLPSGLSSPAATEQFGLKEVFSKSTPASLVRVKKKGSVPHFSGEEHLAPRLEQVMESTKGDLLPEVRQMMEGDVGNNGIGNFPVYV